MTSQGDLFGSSEDVWAERLRRTDERTPKQDFFDFPKANAANDNKVGPEVRPLAERMRPQNLDDYLGQPELLAPGAPLRRLIASDRVPSLVLWGPPGCGKTTLARLLALEARADFIILSAVTSSVKDIRNVVDMAKANLKFQRRTILFIDEIHRFNRAQQDAFLPHVESGIITLFGATTENPSFSIVAPLLSRCRVFVLKPMTAEDQKEMLRRGLALLNGERAAPVPEISIDDAALSAIVQHSDGDARRALGMLEVAVAVKQTAWTDGPLTSDDVAAVIQRHFIYDRQGEEHYNLISALHKTLRSSDPHGAIYWLARMMAAGEEPLYIARRMVRFATEDIGNADPRALTVAMEATRAYQLLGSPEGDLALAQLAIYLAMAPKSNSAYTAWAAAKAEVQRSGSLPVPLQLRNAPTKLMASLDYGKDYTYDHDAEGHFVAKQGLPDTIRDMKFYEPSDQGEEATRREWLRACDEARAKLGKK